MSWSPRLQEIRRLIAQRRHADALDALDDLERSDAVDDPERLQISVLRLLTQNVAGGRKTKEAEALLPQTQGTWLEGTVRLAWAHAIDHQNSPFSQKALLRQVDLGLQAVQRHPDPRLEILLQLLRGRSLIRMRKFPEALTLFRECAEAAESLGATETAILAWIFVSREALRSRSSEGAAAAIRRALALVSTDSPVLYALVLLAKTIHEDRYGMGDENGRNLLEALRSLQGVRTPIRANILNNLAHLALRQRRPAEAREYLLLAQNEQPTAHSRNINLLNLALADLQLGKRAQARRRVEALLQPKDHLVYGQALILRIASSEHPEEAERHLDRLESLAAGFRIRHSPGIDLGPTLQIATQRWTQPPQLAARLRAMQYRLTAGSPKDFAELTQELRELREGGAPLPLGSIELHDPVWGGGMGQVWRGVVRAAKVPVAVKVLGAAQAGPAVTDALRREVRAVARLDHPHIVPLVDQGEISPILAEMSGGELVAGTPWFAMQWASHGTLATWSGTKPWPLIKEALLQLLNALAAAHAMGLLHLDVKPANVLIAQVEPLHTWLTDFGVARALGARSDGVHGGSPAYLAPEQIRGATHQWGPWTDLYAVGGTAITLVQGHSAFQGDPSDQLRQHVHRPLPLIEPRSPVPAGFQRWCAQLMAKDPADRFPCAADAAHALRTLGPPQPVASPARFAPDDTSNTTFVLEDLSELEGWSSEEGEPPQVASRASWLPIAPFHRQLPTLPIRTISPELAIAAWRTLPLRRAPWIGLDAERAELWEALYQVEHGARAIALLGPDDLRLGIMRWLQESALRLGAAEVLWVSHQDPYPWRDALIRLLGLDATTPTEAMGAILDARISPGRLWPSERELILRYLKNPEDSHWVAEPFVLRILQALSHSRRVLVCHASPSVSADYLVSRLLDALPTLRILVVGMAEGLSELPEIPQLTLRELRTGELATLIDTLVPLAPSLRQALLDVCGSDRSMLIWTLNGWMATHALTGAEEGLVQIYPNALPTTLSDAIDWILQTIIPGRLQSTQIWMAAVLGELIHPPHWEAACDQLGIPLQPEVRSSLVTAGLLREQGARLHWAEGVRAVVLQQIPTEARPELYRAAAEVESLPLRKAQHLLDTGDPEDAEQALVPLLQALQIDRMGRIVTHYLRKLIALWDRAVACAEIPPSDPRAVWGRLQILRLLHPEARDLDELERLIAAAQRMGDPDAEALAYLLIARIRQGESGAEGSVPWLRRALSRGISSPLRAQALIQLGHAQMEAEDFEDARQSFAEAASLGASGAAEWEAVALGRLGEPEEALRWFIDGWPENLPSDPEQLVGFLWHRAHLIHHQGDLVQADRHFEEAYAMARVTSREALEDPL